MLIDIVLSGSSDCAFLLVVSDVSVQGMICALFGTHHIYYSVSLSLWCVLFLDRKVYDDSHVCMSWWAHNILHMVNLRLLCQGYN